MLSEITEVQIMPIKQKDGLVAFASIVLNEKFFLGSIGIHSKLEGGYRLTYPTKLVGSKQMNIYHPISREVSDAIEKVVINKYKDVMKKSSDDRHSGINYAIR